MKTLINKLITCDITNIDFYPNITFNIYGDEIIAKTVIRIKRNKQFYRVVVKLSHSRLDKNDEIVKTNLSNSFNRYVYKVNKMIIVDDKMIIEGDKYQMYKCNLGITEKQRVNLLQICHMI